MFSRGTALELKETRASSVRVVCRGPQFHLGEHVQDALGPAPSPSFYHFAVWLGSLGSERCPELDSSSLFRLWALLAHLIQFPGGLSACWAAVQWVNQAQKYQEESIFWPRPCCGLGSATVSCLIWGRSHNVYRALFSSSLSNSTHLLQRDLLNSKRMVQGKASQKTPQSFLNVSSLGAVMKTWRLSLSCVHLFAIPWTAARQALSFTISGSLLKLMSTESLINHPTTSSSATLLSSCLQSFPASGSFTMNQLFTSDGQSIGASASVIPVNIQGYGSMSKWPQKLILHVLFSFVPMWLVQVGKWWEKGNVLYKMCKDFPDCPVIKTPCSQCRGIWVQSLVGELWSCVLQSMAR